MHRSTSGVALAAICVALIHTPVAAQSTRVTWRNRTLTGDQRLLNWKLAVSAGAFRTFAESAAKTDELGLAYIEGASTEKVSPEIQKNLDYNLTPDELTAVRNKLREFNLRMPAYRVENIPADENSRRKLFEFARSLGVETIISSAEPPSLEALDKLATEFEVNVALRGADRDDALARRSKRIGLAVSIDDVPAAKKRLLVLTLRDRSATRMTAVFNELTRLGIRPLVLTLETPGRGDAFANLSRSIEAFEKAVQPALGAFVTEASRSMPIRGPEALPADVRQKIEAAVPTTAYAKPKKLRKLLVVDACVANMSHNTIPHGNLALELMGKKTGAWETVFSNDFTNLKYPKIKQFDAVFLNNTVGELFPDPEVREGLVRFVREGGGLGGLHGSTYASRNWPEFAEMMGAQDAPHRIEPAVIRLDDPNSPINQAFGGKELAHREEYYRFHHNGPTARYTREKLHVLLSIDVEKSDLTRPGRDGRPFYTRPDNDYAISWIRSYGKGRTFNCSLGHMPETFMSPQIMGHIFAAVQFLLGDLDADTTPSAKLAASRRN